MVKECAAEKTKDAREEEKIIPLKGFRKAIAERMTFAARTYAPVTSTWEVDVTQLLELRRKMKPVWEKQAVRVTLTAMLIKAVVQVLKENTIFTSTLKGANIIVMNRINIGLAMAIEGNSFLEDKLIVPVVHDADKKSLIEIARRLEEIVGKVESGSLTMNDVKESTFTISNVGARAYEFIFTPIINPPESAILGVGSITEKPVVRNGEIVVRSILPLMLTYDHRIILPTDTARFRLRLKELLENPKSFIT